jgi:hypothetical protein
MSAVTLERVLLATRRGNAVHIRFVFSIVETLTTYWLVDRACSTHTFLCTLPVQLEQQSLAMDDDERPMMGLGMHPSQVLDPKLAAGRGAEFSAGALVSSTSSSTSSSSKAECSARAFPGFIHSC